MTRVGWDLDGVFYDFAKSVWETMTQLGSVIGEMPPATHWHFYRDEAWRGLTDEQFVDICHYGADRGIIFTYGGLDEEAVYGINTLFYAGYETIIVTDRSFGTMPLVSQKATEDSLLAHGVCYDDIHFTADKASIPLDYMIDDKVENFIALHDEGVDCYLLDRPWNQHVDAGEFRIKSIQEYVDIIIKESALTSSLY